MEKYKKIYKGDVEITKIFVGNEKVWPSVTPITGLTITGETEVVTGNTLQLGITYTPSNTTQQGVTWSSSDETKATVDSNGLVTAIGTGTAIITATSTINGAISDTHNVFINANSNSYAVLKPVGATLPEGVTYGLHEHNGWKYSVTDTNSPNNAFYWNDGSFAGRMINLTITEIRNILGSSSYSSSVLNTTITDTLPVDKWYPDLFYNLNISNCRSTSFPNFGAVGYKLTNMSAGTYKVKIWDVSTTVVSGGSRYRINDITVNAFTGSRFPGYPTVHGTSSSKPQLKEATVTIRAGAGINIISYMYSSDSRWFAGYGAAISAIEIEKIG